MFWLKWCPNSNRIFWVLQRVPKTKLELQWHQYCMTSSISFQIWADQQLLSSRSSRESPWTYEAQFSVEDSQIPLCRILVSFLCRVMSPLLLWSNSSCFSSSKLWFLPQHLCKPVVRQNARLNKELAFSLLLSRLVFKLEGIHINKFLNALQLTSRLTEIKIIESKRQRDKQFKGQRHSSIRLNKNIFQEIDSNKKCPNKQKQKFFSTCRPSLQEILIQWGI